MKAHDTTEYPSSSSRFGKDVFSLGEVVNNAYRAERWNATWVSDTEYAYKNLKGELALFNVESGESSTLESGHPSVTLHFKAYTSVPIHLCEMFCVFCFGTMHTDRVQNKTHETYHYHTNGWEPR